MRVDLLIFLIFLSTLTFVRAASGSSNFNTTLWHCADYYWRDYHGFIPNDAVPAGNDRFGNPRYVGLVYIRKYEYLPAMIIPKEHIAQATAYDLIFNTTEQVKILCGPCLAAFEWIPVHSQDLRQYVSTPPPAIPGGSEIGQDLYIGRVFRDNDAIVGKTFLHEVNGGRGLRFVYQGGLYNSLTFDLLVYNCKKNKCCGGCDRCSRDYC